MSWPSLFGQQQAMSAAPTAAPSSSARWLLPLGYDAADQLVEVNLPELPHLLVAGGYDWQRQKLFAGWFAHAFAPVAGRLPAILVPVATPEVMRLLCPSRIELCGWQGLRLNEAEDLLSEIGLEVGLPEKVKTAKSPASSGHQLWTSGAWEA